MTGFLLTPNVKRSSLVPLLGVGLAILVLGFLGGAAVALGAKQFIVPFFGIVFGLFFLLLPIQWVLWALLLSAFVAVGLIGYFGKLSQIYWIPYLLGLLLYLRVFTAWVFEKRRAPAPMPGFVWWLLIFILTIAFSVAVASPSGWQLLIASKSYFFLWSVMLLYMLLVDEETLLKSWRVLGVIALLQLPVVVFQYVVVGGRITEAGGHGWDAVSGSFGGGETGGNSGSLGVFMVIMLVLAIGAWRQRLLSTGHTVLVVSVFLIPLFLGEVKAIPYVFLPLAMLYYFRREALSSFSRLVAGIALLAAMIFAITFANEVLHYDRGGEVRQSSSISEAIELEINPYHVRKLTGEMGRTALIVFWWQQNGWDDIQHTLFGYGIGASRVSSFNVGEIPLRYRGLKLDRHAASVLLWDTGLFGLTAFSMILVSGAVLSASVSRQIAIPPVHRELLTVGSTALLLMLVSLFYVRMVIDSASMQILMMLCLGQAAYWQRLAATKSLPAMANPS